MIVGLFLLFIWTLKLIFCKHQRCLDGRLLYGQKAIRGAALGLKFSNRRDFTSIVELLGLGTCKVELQVFGSVRLVLAFAHGALIRVFMRSFGANKSLFRTLLIKFSEVMLVKSIHGDILIFAIYSLEDGLLTVSFRVKFLNESYQGVFLRAVVDHRF
jgi:hypothetical protein